MTTTRLLRTPGFFFALLLLLVSLVPAHAAEPRRSVSFDHVRTGFPLIGAHTQVQCETCHAGGRFKGTPTQCATCHTIGSRIAQTVKSARHVPTNLPCEQCHSSTSSWDTARFTHAGVVPGTCTNCHNGAMAPGKPSNHVQTTASCDTCHRTTAWSPASFNHGNVVPGTCANCHNGSQATGKPSNHVQTTSSCDNCHRTTAWTPASFSHATVTPGTCANCHNGSQATGKSGSHFVTTRSCDACHSTSAWVPVRAYTHTSPYYRPHNSGVTCNACHTGNSEVIAWPYSTYKPDCAGCHAARFKPDAHKKVDSPTLLYTVSELRNCSGSCHLYKDNTFTTIIKSRTGEHSSTDGGF